MENNQGTNQQSNMSTVIMIIVIAALGVGGYFLYRTYAAPKAPSTEQQGTNEEQTAGTENVTPSGESTAATKTFTVSGQNFSFTPSAMTVNKGDKVKIIFKNSGGMHDFKIDALAVATPVIANGQEATIEFIATQTGSFEYYCSVGNHRAMGMRGTLVVK